MPPGEDPACELALYLTLPTAACSSQTTIRHKGLLCVALICGLTHTTALYAVSTVETPAISLNMWQAYLCALPSQVQGPIGGAVSATRRQYAICTYMASSMLSNEEGARRASLRGQTRKVRQQSCGPD